MNAFYKISLKTYAFLYKIPIFIFAFLLYFNNVY